MNKLNELAIALEAIAATTTTTTAATTTTTAAATTTTTTAALSPLAAKAVKKAAEAEAAFAAWQQAVDNCALAEAHPSLVRLEQAHRAAKDAAPSPEERRVLAALEAALNAGAEGPAVSAALEVAKAVQDRLEEAKAVVSAAEGDPALEAARRTLEAARRTLEAAETTASAAAHVANEAAIAAMGYISEALERRRRRVNPMAAARRDAESLAGALAAAAMAVPAVEAAEGVMEVVDLQRRAELAAGMALDARRAESIARRAKARRAMRVFIEEDLPRRLPNGLSAGSHEVWVPVGTPDDTPLFGVVVVRESVPRHGRGRGVQFRVHALIGDVDARRAAAGLGYKIGRVAPRGRTRRFVPQSGGLREITRVRH